MNPVRIDIKWTYCSPFLKVASGIVKVWEQETVSTQGKLLFQCKCKVEEGIRGFTSIGGEGIPSALFEKYDSYIKCMIDGYFSGMTLTETQFYWIPESLKDDTNNKSDKKS